MQTIVPGMRICIGGESVTILREVTLTREQAQRYAGKTLRLFVVEDETGKEKLWETIE